MHFKQSIIPHNLWNMFEVQNRFVPEIKILGTQGKACWGLPDP